MNRIHLFKLRSRNVVIADRSTTNKGFNMMYTNTIRLFKGTPNKIEFEVRNSDHKRENIVGLTPVVTIFDSKHQRLLEDRNGTLIYGTPYAFDVIFTSDELDKIENQSAHLAIRLIPSSETSTDLPIIMYGDVGYGVKVPVEIVDGYNDLANKPFVINTFNYSYNFITMSGTYTSELSPMPTVEDSLTDNPNDPNVIVYPGAYIGNIRAEVTSDMSSSNANTWKSVPVKKRTVAENVDDSGIVSKTIVWETFDDHIPIIDNTNLELYIECEKTYSYVRFICEAGNGYGATFDIRKNAETYDVSLVQRGSGYKAGDILVIRGSYLGGDDTINDLTIRITDVNSYPSGALRKTGFTYHGNPSEPVTSEATLFRNITPNPIPKRIAPEKILVLQ